MHYIIPFLYYNTSFQSEVKLFVNRLNTEESVIPYEYNYFDFCVTDDDSKAPVENLGQVVFGERIRASPYNIEFMKNVTCTEVCKKTYDGNRKEDNMRLATLRKGISLNYKHHWIVDNMPLTTCFYREESRLYCSPGFPMGCNTKNKKLGACVPESEEANAYYLYNHVDLTITYHSGVKEDWGVKFGSNGGRIISVKVVPRSINYRE